MKATIQQSNLYDLVISGITFSGFYEESKWEGMVKYRRRNVQQHTADEVVIVDLGERGGFGFTFDAFFKQETEETHDKEVSIIKISTNLLDYIKKEKGESGEDS